MARPQTTFFARYCEKTLYLAGQRGVLQIDAAPALRARKFDLQSPGRPDWQECFPSIRLDRWLGLIEGVRSGRRLPTAYGSSPPTPIPDSVARTADALRAFLQAVGMDSCRCASQFGSSQFAILFYATRFPALCRLLTTNPGLAFAWVARAARLRRKKQDPSVRLDQREKHIAKQLGFPPNCWRVLKRLSPAGLTPRRLEQLRRNLWQPKICRLARHLPLLGPSLVELLGHPSANGHSILSFLDHRFLCEVCEIEGAGEREPGLARLVFAVRSARDRYAPQTPLRITSIPQLERLHFRYVPYLDPQTLGAVQAVRFPPPPVRGNDCVHPIETGEDLIRESIIQDNCTVTHFESVLGGSSYFYRIDAKAGFERCTAQLVREEADDRTIWRLGDVRNRHNRPARRSTVECLAVWLADQQHLPDARVLPQSHPCAFDFGDPVPW